MVPGLFIGSKGRPHREIRHQKELGVHSRKGVCAKARLLKETTPKKQKTAECGGV